MGNGGNHSGNHNDKVVRKEMGDPAMMDREGWDGALVFATDIGTLGRGGALGAAFERRLVLLLLMQGGGQ